MNIETKEKIYRFLVSRNRNINGEYCTYKKQNPDYKGHPVRNFIKIFRLNFHYRILRSRKPLYYFDTNDSIWKELIKAGSESCILERVKPFHWCKFFLKYDVVSFDIFDTLLLRPFDTPQTLFTIIGSRLNQPCVFTDFMKIRIASEKEARDLKEVKTGNREVTIRDIYEIINKKIGLDIETGIHTELEAEKDYLYPNPYIQILFNILKTQGKSIVITSDMYIPHDEMVKLLSECGYTGYEKLFVSCDYDKRKSDGSLFEVVKNNYPGKKIIHIGDNYEADIKGAKIAGIESRYYQNVNSFGNKYRPAWMSSLIGSCYKGLINGVIHNGMNQFPFFYEHGFIYGGIYVLGFCSWLNKKVKENGIEKIIFLARDGDIYQKVYDSYFAGVKTDYLYWSRFAGLKYLSEYNFQAFIERVVLQKCRKSLNETIASVIDEFNLSFLYEKLADYSLNKNDILNDETKDLFQSLLVDNWADVCCIYKKESEIMQKLLLNIIGKTKKIAVVDVGWTGSGPLGVKYFVEKYISDEIEVYGYLAGATSKYGASNSSLPSFYRDRLDSYLFSPLFNKRNLQIHEDMNTKMNNNALFELFTQAQYPSFKGFEDGYCFDVPEIENYKIISEVHQGILDFCELYIKTFGKDDYLLNIPGFDAYRPFATLVIHGKEYFSKFKNIVYSYGIGANVKSQKIETIGERSDFISTMGK